MKINKKILITVLIAILLLISLTQIKAFAFSSGLILYDQFYNINFSYEQKQLVKPKNPFKLIPNISPDTPNNTENNPDTPNNTENNNEPYRFYTTKEIYK